MADVNMLPNSLPNPFEIEAGEYIPVTSFLAIGGDMKLYRRLNNEYPIGIAARNIQKGEIVSVYVGGMTNDVINQGAITMSPDDTPDEDYFSMDDD